MEEIRIAIFDPFLTDESQKLVSIIESNTNYQYDVIRDSRPNYLSVNNSTLLFTILPNFDDPKMFFEYESFLSHVQSMPVIGIVDQSLSKNIIEILQKYIWNFITTPFNKYDILLNIQKFLYNYDSGAKSRRLFARLPAGRAS